jgi:hypothetical protein
VPLLEVAARVADADREDRAPSGIDQTHGGEALAEAALGQQAAILVEGVGLAGSSHPSHLEEAREIAGGIEAKRRDGDDLACRRLERHRKEHGRCGLDHPPGRIRQGNVRPDGWHEDGLSREGAAKLVRTLLGDEIALAHVRVPHREDVDVVGRDDEDADLAVGFDDSVEIAAQAREGIAR